MDFKSRIFWSCQLGGWGILVTVNFIVQVFKDDFHLPEQIFAASIFFAAGVMSTWLLRKTYRRLHLMEMAPLKMLLPVIGLSLLSAILIVSGMLSSLSVFFQLSGEPRETLVASIFIGNLIAIFPLVILWSVLYLALNYLLRWKQSEIDKLSLANALKDAQLNTLIGQVNPHFMFNSLNNIRALMLEDVEKSRDMLTLLSKVLRYSLTSHQQQWISLEEELEMVDDYVTLAKIQYEDRLDFQRQITVVDSTLQVPPMLIQMLVENALKHGIAEVKGGGVLSLQVEQKQQMLCICVSNPGDLLKPSTTLTSTNLGVKNIRDRLRLLYNEKASFSLEEQQGVVKAVVQIPLLQNEDKGKARTQAKK